MTKDNVESVIFLAIIAEKRNKKMLNMRLCWPNKKLKVLLLKRRQKAKRRKKSSLTWIKSDTLEDQTRWQGWRIWKLPEYLREHTTTTHTMAKITTCTVGEMEFTTNSLPVKRKTFSNPDWFTPKCSSMVESSRSAVDHSMLLFWLAQALMTWKDLS